MNTRRLEQTVFWLLPAGVLLVVCVGLSVMTGSAWPWGYVVHEDGSRTLLATLFYVEHATRELIPDALLALAVAGAARYFFRPAFDAGNPAVSRWRLRMWLLVAATLVFIMGGTLWTTGGQSLIDNLSQLHTRSGAPLVWGAHWRYHLIERFAQIMLAFGATGAIWMLQEKPNVHPASGRFGLYGVALLVFATLTIVFRPTTEPFRDPAFLGHQLRELFTHSLVTLPLALGTCLALARRFSITRTLDPGPWTLDPGPWALAPRRLVVLTGTAAVLSGAFLLAASLLTGAESHGQASGLAALLFPHFAEHALGYVLVPALAGLIYLIPAHHQGR